MVPQIYPLTRVMSDNLVMKALASVLLDAFDAIAPLIGASINEAAPAEPIGSTSVLTEHAPNDGAQVSSTVVPKPDESYSYGHIPESDLASYLQRERLLSTLYWSEGYTMDSTLRPWTLILSNANVLCKMNHYYKLRATLHVRIQVTGSLGRYGAFFVSYKPLSTGLRADSPYYSERLDFSGGTIYTQGAMQDMVSRSTRQGHWIFIQDGADVEMQIPLVVPHDALDLSLGRVDTTDFDKLGVLNFNSVAPLRTAVTANTNPLAIKVTGWLSDVQLSGTTVLGLQMSDEYDTKPSVVATKVASAAGMLSKIPVIGPYATATAMHLSTFAKWAHFFGFSNPPVVNPVCAVLPSNLPALSSANARVQMDKLSLDPKAELSIDPHTASAGFTATDEMNINYLCAKQFFLCSASWLYTSNIGRPLFHSYVIPDLAYSNYVEETDGTKTVKYCALTLPPVALVASNFRYWRGDMHITLRINASPYHKGSLIIAYDPFGQFGDASQWFTEGTLLSRVVNIADEKTVEFVIPYSATRHFSFTNFVTDKFFDGTDDETLSQDAFGFNYSTSGTAPSISSTLNRPRHNGYVRVAPYSRLEGPVDSVVDVAVFVHWSNVVFGDPVPLNVDYTMHMTPPLGLQMADTRLNAPANESLPSVHHHTPVHPHTPSIFMGEAVVSMRTLLSRAQWLFSISTNKAIETVSNKKMGHAFASVTTHIPRLPIPGGKTLYAHYHCTKDHTTENYNFGPMPLLTLVSSCYVGCRGGIVYRIKGLTGGLYDLRGLSVYRCDDTFKTAQTDVRDTLLSNSGCCKSLRALNHWSSCGIAVTDARLTDSLSVVVPQYSGARMLPGNPMTPLTSTISDGRDSTVYVPSRYYDKLAIRTDYQYRTMSWPNENIPGGASWEGCREIGFQAFAHAGTDYSCFGFLNVPTLFISKHFDAATDN